MSVLDVVVVVVIVLITEAVAVGLLGVGLAWWTSHHPVPLVFTQPVTKPDRERDAQGRVLMYGVPKLYDQDEDTGEHDVVPDRKPIVGLE